MNDSLLTGIFTTIFANTLLYTGLYESSYC